MSIYRRIFTCTIIVFSCCLSIPAASDITSGIRETKLANGLTILTKEVRVAPVVSVNVFYDVGSRNEHTGITGVSHLLEHMMFKGSTHFAKGKFEQMVRERGGVNNAATWTDFTYYWELLQSDYLEMALTLESDRMWNALFKKEDLVSEMPVVRSELEGGENSPDTLLWNQVNAAAFTAHPYQWPIIGWRSDVEGMSRDQIYGYYKTHYGPNNATVILVGDFDSDKAIALVKKHFGGLKPVPKPPAVHTVEPVQRGERRVDLRTAGSAQRVLIGWKIPAQSDPDNYALDMLEQILSGGRSSRLYQSLVETGIAVDAYAYSGTKTDPSLFYVGATAQQGKSAADVEKALLAQIDAVAQTPPTDEEIKRARNQIEAGFVFSNDDVSSQAQMIGRTQMLIGWKKLADYLPSIGRVNAADVQRVAKKYFVQETRTVGVFIPTGPSAEPEGRPTAPGGTAHYRASDDPGAIRPIPSTRSKTAKSLGITATAPKKISPTRYSLPNGATLIVLRNPANPSISISGSLWAGKWAEGKDQDNVADVTADLLTRGTTSRTSLQFARAVEEMGASLSFSASDENTRIGGKCLSRDFSSWVNLAADALRNPVFPEQEMTRLNARNVAILEQEAESPESLAQRAFMNKLYPEGHVFHQGTVQQDISAYQSITVEAVKRFYADYYGPKGMILTVVGDIQPDAAKAIVEKAFDGWRAQTRAEHPSIPDVTTSSRGFEYIRVPDKTETSAIYGWNSGLKRSSPDYYSAVVMNDILGGGSVLSSRLGKSIRGKMGLVYDVSTWFNSGLGAGPWQASLGSNPKNAEKAIKELVRGVMQMRQIGPTNEEVQTSKQYITGTLSLRLATNAGIAGFLHSAEFYELGLDYLNNFRNIYGAVTPEQVRKAAQSYLHPESATLVVAGPAESFPNVIAAPSK